MSRQLRFGWSTSQSEHIAKELKVNLNISLTQTNPSKGIIKILYIIKILFQGQSWYQVLDSCKMFPFKLSEEILSHKKFTNEAK